MKQFFVLGIFSLSLVCNASNDVCNNVCTFEQSESQGITIAASDVTYLRDVTLFTYNMRWQRFERYGTAKLYQNSSRQLFLNDGWLVHNNYDRRIPYNFWVVDKWGTYYYFD